MLKKLLGAGVVLALVATVLVGVGASTASAQSVTCANIDSMLMVLGITDAAKVAQAKAALGCGTSMASGYTFTRDLTVGSTGADVTALQVAVGVSPATGYFGPITLAAVKVYQTSKGISATGYVGPLTRGALNAAVVVTPPVGGTFPAGCTSAAGYSSTTGQPCSTVTPAPSTGLSGNAGSITVTSLATYSGEKIKAGEEDVKVLGIEIEADEESDVDITSMKVELKQTDTDSSDRIKDYVESIDIYMGTTKVGSADASDFTESSNIYTKSVSLNGAVIRAGEKAKFYIALNAVSNLDSGDIDDENFSIDILSQRFVDGDGVSTTDSTAVTAREADFEDLSTSGDIEVKVSEHTSNPESSNIQVSTTTNTSDVLLLATNLRAKGSDITIDQLTFDITPTGADANAIVNEYKLLIDGVEIASLAATAIDTATTEQITFTSLEEDFAVSDGDTVVVKLVADILDTGEGSFGDGDSILASLTNADLLAASSTIEDENGDDVAAGDRVGGVTGSTIAFYVNGIEITPGTITEDVSDTTTSETNDRGTYVIKFDVTAFGADAYVDSQSASVGSDGVEFSINGDTFTGTMTSNVTCASNCTAGTGNYLVPEGTTKTFTLTVVLTNDVGAAGFYGVQIDEVGIGAADDSTGETTVTTGLEDLETDEVNLES